MKIKSVLATFAAAAVVSTTSVTAFADTDNDDNDTLAVLGNNTIIETLADTATVDGEKDSENTGAEGVAVVLGVIALSGAAVVISRKKV